MTYRTSAASSLAIVLALGALLPGCNIEVGDPDPEPDPVGACPADEEGSLPPVALACDAFSEALTLSDDPERVCEALLQFERDEGTLATYDLALQKVCEKRVYPGGHCSVQTEQRARQVAEKEVQKEKQRKKAATKDRREPQAVESLNRKQRRQLERGEPMQKKSPPKRTVCSPVAS